jgi:hypothetical protein
LTKTVAQHVDKPQKGNPRKRHEINPNATVFELAPSHEPGS